MRKSTILLILVFTLASSSTFAQKVYSTSAGEIIFSMANVEFKENGEGQFPDEEAVRTNVRFTAWFHVGQHWHIDFTNNIGLYTGFGIRNIGLISDERLRATETSDLRDYKIIRRTYSLGVPLAIKIGSFGDHLFFYAGGEYEWSFHQKAKYWQSHSRSGAKTKTSNWFGDQTPAFLPSVFAGAQLPGGINLKFKYYLDNFINDGYKDNNDHVLDQTRYKTSEVFYISLSWHFNSEYVTKKKWQTDDVAYNY